MFPARFVSPRQFQASSTVPRRSCSPTTSRCGLSGPGLRGRCCCRRRDPRRVTPLRPSPTQANLPAQFDVAVFVDRTSALRPLDSPEESTARPGTPDLMESEEEEEEFEG